MTPQSTDGADVWVRADEERQFEGSLVKLNRLSVCFTNNSKEEKDKILISQRQMPGGEEKDTGRIADFQKKTKKATR
jgi:hypothetical protein